MRMKRFILTASIFFVAGCAGNDKKSSLDENMVEANINGELLFKANCASCHKPDKDFTGPALKGSLQRWGGDKKAMYAFIRNPSKLIERNMYARELAKKWGGAKMTSFNLSDAEIDAIMKYAEK